MFQCGIRSTSSWIRRNGGDAIPLCCSRHPEKEILCSEPDHFLIYSPEGGCDLPCERRLDDCGHRCQSKCHSQAMHNAFSCIQQCRRIRSTCSHPCPRPCGVKCGQCLVTIPGFELPCGHSSDVKCHQLQDLGSIKCVHPVLRAVPSCGHRVEVECQRDVSASSFLCPKSCPELLPCGHICPGTCGVCCVVSPIFGPKIAHQACLKLCGRTHGTCKHNCRRACHDGEACGSCEVPCEVKCPHSACTQKCAEPCAPCIEPCTWTCPHQGRCTMPCAAPCNRLPCDNRCEQTLSCGHRCPSICGEECAEGYCQICNTEKHDARVDLLEFKTYGEIEVDETPIVVLGCGHFFITESLDGYVGMSEVYVEDDSGRIIGLRDASGMMDTGVPSCPDCKRPIRQFATRRYNRVINRAVRDESSEKLPGQGTCRDPPARA